MEDVEGLAYRLCTGQRIFGWANLFQSLRHLGQSWH